MAGFAAGVRSIGEGGVRGRTYGSILLVYFVADESGSMGRHIGELKEGRSTLHDALQRESFARRKRGSR